MRDLYHKGKDAPLIDFSSSEEEEGDDDEDVGVFGRKKSGSGDSLVPGGPLEMVAIPFVDLSHNTRGEEGGQGGGEEEEDVFGFKKGVQGVMSGEDVELLRNPPPENLSGKPAQTLIDIDVSTETEEKLVDVDASSSRTISPMEPVVLSTVVPPSRVVSREASPVPAVPVVEPLVHLPVAVRPVVQAPVVFAPDLDEVVGPAAESVEGREEEELVHVAYEDAVVVPVRGNEAEEEEGVLVDVSPRPVDAEVSLAEAVVVDVEASQPEVVDVSAAEVVDVEVSQPGVVEVSRPVDVGVSAPEVVEVFFPKTTDSLVDVDASPEPTKPADTTSSQKPTAWQWDEEDEMMRAWSLGLDLVEAPLPLDSDAQVVATGSPPLPDESESLLDEKPSYDLLIQQQQQDPESPPPVENSPPLPLLPPLTIPLITISDTKREQQEEYPDPELLPLPDFFSSSTKEGGKNRSQPSQTPTPPDSPPLPPSSSSPGGLVVKSTRTAPSSPRLLPSISTPASSPLALTRPAWSLRAADAPPLGLSSSSSSSSATPVASPSLMRKGGVALKEEEEAEAKVQEEGGEEEETDKDKIKFKLSEALPGSFPDSQAPSLSDSSSSSNTTTTTTTTTSINKTISALMSTPDTTRRMRVSRSPLDIALAMQLRPGLGVGADPAWMVRFLMAMFGWFAILVSGQGEF